MEVCALHLGNTAGTFELRIANQSSSYTEQKLIKNGNPFAQARIAFSCPQRHNIGEELPILALKRDIY